MQKDSGSLLFTVEINVLQNTMYAVSENSPLRSHVPRQRVPGPTTITRSHRVIRKGKVGGVARVVSRSSPELKSGASRPSLSIRCTGKRVVSQVLAHEHRRDFARRRETITRRTQGGPICQVAFFE